MAGLSRLICPASLAKWVKGVVSLGSEVKFLLLVGSPSDVAGVWDAQCLTKAPDPETMGGNASNCSLLSTGSSGEA